MLNGFPFIAVAFLRIARKRKTGEEGSQGQKKKTGPKGLNCGN